MTRKEYKKVLLRIINSCEPEKRYTFYDIWSRIRSEIYNSSPYEQGYDQRLVKAWRDIIVLASEKLC